MSAASRLTYIGDPMCSWCWGFAPVLDAIRQDFLPQIEFRLILGGLRPGPMAAPLDVHMKSYLREHWSAVEARTGQRFAWGLMQRNDFLYDTEPASRAIVTVRRLNPTQEYDYFCAVQEAFYTRSEDVTDENVLATLALTQGLDKADFLALYRDEATETATDYRFARKMGVQGFPTLLLQRADKVYPVTHGYQTYARLKPVICDLLAE